MKRRVRLLYSTAVDEIAGFKQQQWHITNYGLLVYAAIVSVFKLFGDSIATVERALLSGGALAVENRGSDHSIR